MHEGPVPFRPDAGTVMFFVGRHVSPSAIPIIKENESSTKFGIVSLDILDSEELRKLVNKCYF